MQHAEIHGGTSRWRHGLRLSLLVLLAVLSCAIVMVATVPAPYVAARLGFAQGPASVSGTIWQGQAMLPGQHRLHWQARGWQSLRQLALVADLTLTGPGADLEGRLALRPSRARLLDLSGTTGWPLVEAVLPGLAFGCPAVAVLATATGSISRQDRDLAAQAAVPPGRCTRATGGEVPHPALSLTVATGDAGILGRLTDASGTELVRATLTPDDRLRLTVAQAGARLVPGMPATADSEIDLPLALVFR